mmetsp:Transcript_25119/g.79631  ORF Transcript_25119/g.79631 Transcript_25119/m.79631 type:complete len:170 (-) Transcript_25119:213-722(-)
MGKLRDWLLGDGNRPRWSVLQFAVAAYAEDLQDELQDEWKDWTTDDFASEFDDSCSECDDDEAVDRAREWLGWSPLDRRADGHSDGDGYSDGDEEEDNVPLVDSTYGECDEPRLTDDRRLQDMIDATAHTVRRDIFRDRAWEADGRVRKHGSPRGQLQRGIRLRPRLPS